MELMLTGEELYKMIHSYSRMSTSHFPHLGGIIAEVKLDKKDPTVIRNFKLMTPDGKAINKKKTYKIVTNSYITSTCNTIDPDDVHMLNSETSDLIMQFLEQQQHVNYRGVKRITYK